MAKKIPNKSDYWYYLFGIFSAAGKSRKEAIKLADWYSSEEYNSDDNTKKDIDSVTNITSNSNTDSTSTN